MRNLKIIVITMSGEVQAKMCLLFDVPAEIECRLWQRYITNSYDLLSKLSHTISDAGLYDGQVGVVYMTTMMYRFTSIDYHA